LLFQKLPDPGLPRLDLLEQLFLKCHRLLPSGND
jgi:hypothetical protein